MEICITQDMLGNASLSNNSKLQWLETMKVDSFLILHVLYSSAWSPYSGQSGIQASGDSISTYAFRITMLEKVNVLNHAQSLKALAQK